MPGTSKRKWGHISGLGSYTRKKCRQASRWIARQVIERIENDTPISSWMHIIGASTGEGSIPGIEEASTVDILPV